jgi:hypothetical protein
VKYLDSCYFVTLFDFLSLKYDVSVPSKSNKQKKLCSIIVFPDADPPQNVIDPQHCIIQMHPLWYSTILYFSASHGTRFCLPFLVRSGQILQIQINGLNLKV